MKRNQPLWVVLLFVLLVGFNTACQRDRDNVKAAREENATPANTPSTDTNILTPQDKDSAMKIEQSNLGEIDLARLAEQRATNRDVKNYADMIENDHMDALKDLQKIMKDHGVTESTQSKPADSQAELTKMQALSGAAFDREYMNTMTSGHQKALEELRSNYTSVQNSDLKDYINNLMKKVEEHLNKAQDLQTKLITKSY